VQFGIEFPLRCTRETNEIFNKDLDVPGSLPVPILRAKKALAELKSGEVLRLATDPGSVKDFQRLRADGKSAALAR